MEQTAMMELIEKLEVQAELYELENLTVFTCINDTVRMAKQLIEKEKKQIERAYDMGYVYSNKGNSLEYYNQTYLK